MGYLVWLEGLFHCQGLDPCIFLHSLPPYQSSTNKLQHGRICFICFLCWLCTISWYWIRNIVFNVIFNLFLYYGFVWWQSCMYQMVLSKITPVNNFTVRIFIVDVYWVYFSVIFIVTAVVVKKSIWFAAKACTALFLIWHTSCKLLTLIDCPFQVCLLLDQCLAFHCFFCSFVWLCVNGNHCNWVSSTFNMFL